MENRGEKINEQTRAASAPPTFYSPEETAGDSDVEVLDSHNDLMRNFSNILPRTGRSRLVDLNTSAFMHDVPVGKHMYARIDVHFRRPYTMFDDTVIIYANDNSDINLVIRNRSGVCSSFHVFAKVQDGNVKCIGGDTLEPSSQKFICLFKHPGNGMTKERIIDIHADFTISFEENEVDADDQQMEHDESDGEEAEMDELDDVNEENVMEENEEAEKAEMDDVNEENEGMEENEGDDDVITIDD